MSSEQVADDPVSPSALAGELIATFTSFTGDVINYFGADSNSINIIKRFSYTLDIFLKRGLA